MVDSLTARLGAPASAASTQCTSGPGEILAWTSHGGKDYLRVFIVNGVFGAYTYGQGAPGPLPVDFRTSDGVGIGTTVAVLRSTYGTEFRPTEGGYAIGTPDAQLRSQLVVQLTGANGTDTVTGFQAVLPAIGCGN